MISKTKDKLNVIVTGGSGRFGSVIKNIKSKYKVIFPNKLNLDILNLQSIESFFKRSNPSYVIHMAGLSRPMNIHDKNIEKSISLNIIGTSNIVIACKKYNCKLIYISTNFVYPGKKGDYKENDSLNPVNNYAWSKLGGESAVRMYKNSLILRVCTTEEPFIHKKAFTDVITNFEYHKVIGNYIFKLINKKGVINLGGKAQSVYNFAKGKNLKVKKISAKKKFGRNYPLRQDMNLDKLKKFIKI